MRDGSIELDFGNGRHEFRVGWRELIALQERLKVGPSVLFERLVSDQFRSREVAEVIRIGLIGGGMAKRKAATLVRRHVEDRPLSASVHIAAAVLFAGLEGDPEENKLGEAGGEIAARPRRSTISPMAAGASLLCSVWRGRSAFRLPIFSACRCGSSSPTSTAG